MQRKGGDKNGILVKNLDTINTSVMEKFKKCEERCTCDQNLNELGGEYSMSKTTRKEKEQGYGICANKYSSGGKLKYFEMLCHTWERLRCTGQLLKYSIFSTMTLDAGWTHW